MKAVSYIYSNDQANTLAERLCMCSEHVTAQLFLRAHRYTLYTAPLWDTCKKASIHKPQVDFTVMTVSRLKTKLVQTARVTTIQALLNSDFQMYLSTGLFSDSHSDV